MGSSTEAGPEPADRYATVNGLAIHCLEWGARGLRPLILLQPQVEIVTMPGLGHYPVDEDTPGFLAIVDRFLEKNLRKSRSRAAA